MPVDAIDETSVKEEEKFVITDELNIVTKNKKARRVGNKNSAW